MPSSTPRPGFQPDKIWGNLTSPYLKDLMVQLLKVIIYNNKTVPLIILKNPIKKKTSVEKQTKGLFVEISKNVIS